MDVSVATHDGECEIRVSDTGVGIPGDQLESIFDRYRRVDGDARKSSGVGLGLYIARLITEAHAGRVWAESPATGGATFRVRLPLST